MVLQSKFNTVIWVDTVSAAFTSQMARFLELGSRSSDFSVLMCVMSGVTLRAV